MNESLRFQLIEYEDADDELKAIYDEVMEALAVPFVPNWFKCQGANPSLLRGNWDKVRYTLLMGDVPKILKELIIYNISKERTCQYCSFAHKLGAEAEGQALGWQQSFEITEHLDNDFIPSSYKTAIQVVTKCALEPLATTHEDFELLQDEGFSDHEIQELMAQADLANVLITIAEISGIEIDQEFFQAFHNAPTQTDADLWVNKPLYTDNYPSFFSHREALHCHSERSEESRPDEQEILRFAQNDKQNANTPPYRMVEYEEASREVRAVYDDIMNVMGLPFVLNFFKCQGGILPLLKGRWNKIKATLYGGEIPMLLKQLIMYNVSKSRNCTYCTFIHKKRADALSSLLYDGEGFQVTQHLIPPSYNTAIEIVTRWALSPSFATDDDFEALRDEGFSEREIQELMSQADLINMLNTTADIFGIEIDQELFASIS